MYKDKKDNAGNILIFDIKINDLFIKQYYYYYFFYFKKLIMIIFFFFFENLIYN